MNITAHPVAPEEVMAFLDGELSASEARAVSDAALTISVSEEDARALRKLSPRGQVAPVPTGVDLEYFVPDRSAEVNDRIVRYAGPIRPL